MSTALITAGVLTVLLAAAHSYLGERYILVPLFRTTELPPLLGRQDLTKQTLRFAWHITSVFALGFASLLWLIGRTGGVEGPAVAVIIAACCAISGAMALVGSRGRHLSWIVFFAIAGLAWFA